MKLLEIKLDCLVLEGRKLFANLPRFQRLGKEGIKDNGKAENRREANGFVKEVRNQDWRAKGWVDNRSFAEVIQNQKAYSEVKGESSVLRTFKLCSEEDDLKRYVRAYIGIIRELGMTTELKNIFLEEDIFTIRVTTLSHNLCIL